MQFTDKLFFLSPFVENEMFCLPKKFALFTCHMQPLKCVQQNSYLDLRSNTLYMKMKSFTGICFTYTLIISVMEFTSVMESV